MNQPKETPKEKIKRLSEIISHLDGLPLGVSECGCPNNLFHAPPAIHICQECGFEGSERLHQNCPGCYINIQELK